MRLIDADELADKHCDGCSADIREMCKTDPVCASMMWVVEEPTVDAVEVVHGRWEKDPDMRRMNGHIYDYRCSHCHSQAEKGYYNNNDRFTNYCPNCGARMDLEV